MSVETRPHDSVSTKSVRCRIPQRLGTFRSKPLPYRPKPVNDGTKSRCDTSPVSQIRYSPRTSILRPKSTESRPKSSNGVKEKWTSEKYQHPVNRTSRSPTAKRPSTLPRRLNFTNEKRSQRPVITVPMASNSYRPVRCNSLNSELPDQETIQKSETLEIQKLLNNNSSDQELCVPEAPLTKSEQAIQLKIKWQENMVAFEQMKHDLEERQQGIISLYAKMRNSHKKLLTSGQSVAMPSAEELRIMNVHKLSPEQLLQLCSLRQNDNKHKGAKNIQIVDTNRLHNTQKKLVATCEQTLHKRREMIDWFEALRCAEKSVSMRVLAKRTNEFIAETEMLQSSMAQARDEMDRELNDVVDFVRKNLNETMALQLRTEKLTYKLTEINSRNEDLQKQIRHLEHLKSMSNRSKLEELEKELSEEKCKRLIIRDKLSKSEGQVKMEKERAAQLETTLAQARSQSWSLERTVQQLHEQNHKLQNDFDTELQKLKDSIKENTMHLEEIVTARETLQNEKGELEKQLQELSNSYNESLANAKQETDLHVVKLIETEAKYDQVLKEKTCLESKVESLTNQLIEAETEAKEEKKVLRSTVDLLTNKVTEVEACTNAIKMEMEEKDKKLVEAEVFINKLKNEAQEKERLAEEAKQYHDELKKQMREKEKILGTAMDYEKQLQSTKQDLNTASNELDEYKIQISDLKNIVKELKRTSEESQKLEEILRMTLTTKEEYVSKLEKTQSLLEQRLQDSEHKMETYEKQLVSLKSHMCQLKEEVGEFENLSDLRDLINKERAKVTEATNKNNELKGELKKKEEELEQQLDNVAEQELQIQQRDDVIKMFSDKDDEHAKIIKILQNNLEMRTGADVSLNQIVAEKNREIESLITNIETRKQQILEMENIILALEDQSLKYSKQKKNDEEKIKLLEQKLMNSDSYHIEKPHMQIPHNIDSLMKMIEDELGTSIDDGKKKFAGDRNHDKINRFEYHKGNKQNQLQSDGEPVPTKIVMGNFVKKTYIPKDRRENLDHKKAITNNDTQKHPALEPNLNVYATPPVNKDNYPTLRGLIPAGCHIKDNLLSRNIQFLANNQLRGDKKSRMFKFAGHKI